MTLLRIPILLMAALANHVAFTPPMPPPTKEQLMKELSPAESLFTTMSRLLGILHVTVGWTSTICEILVILARTFPWCTIGQFILPILTTAPRQDIPLNALFLIGCTLVIFGGLIRGWCYRVLGRHFTYELTLLDKHLLCTHGPYSAVRHPAYTGAVMTIVGLFLWNASDGSWFMGSGIPGTLVGKVVVGTFVTLQIYACLGVILRTEREDDTLKKAFGNDWERWAQEVPCKLVPGFF